MGRRDGGDAPAAVFQYSPGFETGVEPLEVRRVDASAATTPPS